MQNFGAASSHRTAGEYVTIDSVALHAKLEDLFGLPQVDEDRTTDELFGPYPLDGSEVFWKYRPAFASWSVLTASEQPGSVYVDHLLADPDEMAAAFHAVRKYPPRGLPSDPNVQSAREPFAFEGWRFCWMYFPELARWELAPRGRA